MSDTAHTPSSNPQNEPIGFDARIRKVMELRRLVREGLYRPDAEEVARAILAEWEAVGGEVERESPPADVSTCEGRRQIAEHFIRKPQSDTEAVRAAVSA
jgi:hypothetical protein